MGTNERILMERLFHGKPPKCHKNRAHFANGMCRQCYQRHWRTVINPSYYHDFNAKQKYGLSPKDHNRLLARKKCGICRKIPKEGKIRNLVIDHDHRSNKVRGVLCRQCNANVGWLETRTRSIEKFLHISIKSKK